MYSPRCVGSFQWRGGLLAHPNGCGRLSYARFSSHLFSVNTSFEMLPGPALAFRRLLLAGSAALVLIGGLLAAGWGVGGHLLSPAAPRPKRRRQNSVFSVRSVLSVDSDLAVLSVPAVPSVDSARSVPSVLSVDAVPSEDFS